MMRLLRVIMKGLRAAMRALGRAAAAPFAWLGGGGYDDTDFDEIDDRESVINEREAKMEAAEAQAREVTRYAAASLIDDAPAPLPADLPPALREWCRGLSRDESLAICGARPEAVSAHIQGIFMLPDVRKVQKLPAAQWPGEPSPEYDDGSLDVAPSYAI
jgi:hypothetical protein